MTRPHHRDDSARHEPITTDSPLAGPSASPLAGPLASPLAGPSTSPQAGAVLAPVDGGALAEGQLIRGELGPRSPYPHRARIEAALGAAIPATAFLGPEASAACDRLGARGAAAGDQVAFASPAPSLHTAAHEAAHTLQATAGVRLDAIETAGADPLEAHADAVADRVVRGESAADLFGGEQAASAVVRLDRNDDRPTTAAKPSGIGIGVDDDGARWAVAAALDIAQNHLPRQIGTAPASLRPALKLLYAACTGEAGSAQADLGSLDVARLQLAPMLVIAEGLGDEAPSYAAQVRAALESRRAALLTAAARERADQGVTMATAAPAFGRSLGAAVQDPVGDLTLLGDASGKALNAAEEFVRERGVETALPPAIAPILRLLDAAGNVVAARESDSEVQQAGEFGALAVNTVALAVDGATIAAHASNDTFALAKLGKAGQVLEKSAAGVDVLFALLGAFTADTPQARHNLLLDAAVAATGFLGGPLAVASAVAPTAARHLLAEPIAETATGIVEGLMSHAFDYLAREGARLARLDGRLRNAGALVTVEVDPDRRAALAQLEVVTAPELGAALDALLADCQRQPALVPGAASLPGCYETLAARFDSLQGLRGRTETAPTLEASAQIRQQIAACLADQPGLAAEETRRAGGARPLLDGPAAHAAVRP